MKQGELGFDNADNCYIVMYGDGKSFNRSLHCGDVLEVLIGQSWHPVRIEYSDGWYFVGADVKIKSGLIVRTA